MRSIFKSAAVSWKTTAIGVLIFLEVLAVALIAFLDQDPATMPDWNSVVTAAFAMFGLLFAKDGNKSTEDHE